MRRIFELILTIPALFFLSLPMLLIAGGIRLTMGNPVFFRQIRPGLHGTPFTLYKFRTMRNAYDKNGLPLPDEARLTWLGKVLRSTSLDELPELFNILKGEMSIVGPRPLLMRYLDRYTPYQARRHEVKPGLTGWAQVNGRNALSWERKFELDVWYVENQSVFLDIKIVLMTIMKILSQEGISHPGQATMHEFKGSDLNQ